jgi:ATP-binding cassette subfamily B protein
MSGRARPVPRPDWDVDDSRLPSGLTGSVDLPEPPAPPGLPWRARLQDGWASIGATARALPRVLRLCWRSSAAATAVLAPLTITVGLLPVLAASTARLLFDAVVHTARVSGEHQPDISTLTLPVPGAPHVSGLSGTWTVFWLAFIQFAIMMLSALASALQGIAQRVLSDGLSLTVETMIVEKASQLELAFFERSESYDLLQRATGQATMRPYSLLTTLITTLQAAVTFGGMIGLLIGLNPLLGVIVLVTPIPAFIVDSRYGSRAYRRVRRTSPVHRRIQYIAGLLTTDVAAKEVRVFGLGPYLVERYRLLSANYAAQIRELMIRRQVAEFGWGIVGVLAQSGSFLYVALRAANGKLTIGGLMLYGTAASSVQTSVSTMLNSLTQMYENNLYLDDLFRLMEVPGERSTRVGSGVPKAASPALLTERSRPAGPSARPASADGNRPGGHVVFEEVSFQYPGTGEAALTDVSFEVFPGETVALVGRNGAGKSTLVKLLCGLYLPTTGRVLIDGADIAEADPDTQRAQISAVFQDHMSFQATAAENIGLGDLRAIDDRSRIERAGQAGGADGFVRSLPRGYDSSLGRWFRDGVNLSGGEWQKLALARGFMRDARILVLDEPSAALDARAEHELFARLRALATGRTAFYISHRFSSVRQADRIIYLENGRVVEAGTHRELMDLDGRYAELFALQAVAYIDGPTPAAVSEGDMPAVR